MHGTPPWLTVNVWPATVSVPLRAPPVFAATVNETVPGPLLLALPVIVSHAALAVAVQAQPVADCTLKLPGPPVALTEVLVGLIE